MCFRRTPWAVLPGGEIDELREKIKTDPSFLRSAKISEIMENMRFKLAERGV